MSSRHQVLVFALGDERYGMPLPSVERVVRMVDVTPLPQAPGIVLGVVNVQGRVIPVLNLHRRFRLREHDISLTDQLIIARTTKRPVALVVDAVNGVFEYSAHEAIGASDIVPGIEYIDGVVKLADGLLLVHDLDRFLSLEEETALDRAIEGA